MTADTYYLALMVTPLPGPPAGRRPHQSLIKKMSPNPDLSAGQSDGIFSVTVLFPQEMVCVNLARNKQTNNKQIKTKKTLAYFYQ